MRELLYPYLIECGKFTNDIFWKTIFEDLAYGIPPCYTYISKDILICKYKDKEFAYKLQQDPNKDFVTTYNEIIELLKTKLNMLSYSEILFKKTNIDKFYNTCENIDSWNNIKRKNVKEMYIEKFVINMKIKYSLSIQQARYLMNVIFLTITYKVITSSDIIIENGEIDHINGIEIYEKTVILSKNIYSDIHSNVTPEIILDRKMSDEWPKFLANLRKLC